MEARIRYKKDKKDGVLVSVRDLISKSTGAKYRVKIYLDDCSYKIFNINTERSYPGGEGINNLHVLKRKIKADLEQRFGVSFSTETRDNSCRKAGVNCSYKKEK